MRKLLAEYGAELALVFVLGVGLGAALVLLFG